MHRRCHVMWRTQLFSQSLPLFALPWRAVFQSRGAISQYIIYLNFEHLHQRWFWKTGTQLDPVWRSEPKWHFQRHPVKTFLWDFWYIQMEKLFWARILCFLNKYKWKYISKRQIIFIGGKFVLRERKMDFPCFLKLSVSCVLI